MVKRFARELVTGEADLPDTDRHDEPFDLVFHLACPAGRFARSAIRSAGSFGSRTAIAPVNLGNPRELQVAELAAASCRIPGPVHSTNYLPVAQNGLKRHRCRNRITESIPT